jgi:tetratricopeptide (TPR) repeat protein
VLSFFGKKKSDAPEGAAKEPQGAFKPEPDKAARWFHHGKTAIGQQNYPYALYCMAMGLKFEPNNMAAHESMYEAGIRHFQGGGKAARRDDIKKVDGPGPVDKFAAAEFAWMHDLNNLALAMELLEATTVAGQVEFGRWLAPRVLNMLRKQQVRKKGPWLAAKDAFAKAEAWNEAFAAAETALEIDPSDGQLANQIKELQAQQAMERGGFNAPQTAQNDFRRNIKDAEKQQALDDAERLAGGTDVEARNIERAKKDFEDNPMSPEAIAKYAQVLRRRTTAEDEEAAHAVYMIGFERLGEYRFRMGAGDIRLSQIRRRLKVAKDRLDAAPTDLVLKAEVESISRELLEAERTEYSERALRYPTDRGLRIELGRIEYELGHFEEAMGSFQSAKDEVKYRLKATFMLGRCFAAMSWHTEAISEFREALQGIDSTSRDIELDIRYELMLSLIEQAKAERSPGAAKEAFDICSAIVRTNIGYRDIRDRRKEIEQLRKDLGG